MNKQQLRTDLEKDYKLVAFVDFAEVSHTPTAAYHLLASIRKDVFDDNERIVFYGNYPDIELVNHVSHARELLDIGEFFCIWQNEIEDADVPGTGYQVAKDTICPLLWSHLEVRHTGNVHPCCVSTDYLGNANESTLSEIYHSGAMDTLRNQLLSGVKVPGCSHCWRIEEQGLTSNRQWHVSKNEKEFYAKWYDNLAIRSLDLKPGNVCNFKCRTCNPTSSSLIADEYRQLQIKAGHAIPISNRWDGYNQYAWAELDRLLPDIENLDFYGGEPFLLKELRSFLHGAVNNGHAGHIRVHVNTNGSIYPKDLIDTLLKFKEIDIAISIDNIEQRFELERGGTWAEVESNVLKFKELANNSNINVCVMPTVNIQNVYYLGELIDWANQNGIRYVLNFLDEPKYFNINFMTPTAKQLIADKYSQSPITELRNIAEQVANSVGSDGSEFVQRVGRFDRIRNQNFASTHKEIAQAMGYNLISQQQV